MSNNNVRLPYDPTGRNPDNLVGSEPHVLKPIAGFPYKIVTMIHGGFYSRSLRVYDANYQKLILGTDYIVTYRFANLSQRLGLNVCAAIVFLDPARVGKIYASAQMVGGDLAYSFTVVTDYVDWFKQQPAGYVPTTDDFNGNEPIWAPGELDKERWRLDTYEPFNNEIYMLGRANMAETGPHEQDFREKVTKDYNDFLDMFNDRLERHIRDTANPHVDAKSDVGLGLVENYKLATILEARAGSSNSAYLTPYLSWLTVDEFALKPLNAHIADKANPHKTTPATIDAPTKATVQGNLDNKYLLREQVRDTNAFSDGTSDYSYSAYYQLARTKIPAANFAVGGANGYINPRRIGRGNPSANTILRSDGYWVTWESLIIERGSSASPSLMVVGTNYSSQNAAHAAAISLPWAYSAPVGSMIFYTYLMSLLWGSGNGSWVSNSYPVGASYKSASGWIAM